VATDVDVPSSTTPTGTAKASSHDVVEVISEQELKELMAKEKKKKQEAAEREKDITDKELQPNGAERKAAKLVARQSMAYDGEFLAEEKSDEAASVNAVTPLSLDTTLMTITRRLPLETEVKETKTMTQSSSCSAGKPRFEGPRAEVIDFAASTTLTARSSLTCITLRSQGAHSTICPDSSCWNGDC
jgi:hypothetical protein